jgi:hypothetical protein
VTQFWILAGIVVGVMLLCTGAYLEHHQHHDEEDR